MFWKSTIFILLVVCHLSRGEAQSRDDKQPLSKQGAKNGSVPIETKPAPIYSPYNQQQTDVYGGWPRAEEAYPQISGGYPAYQNYGPYYGGASQQPGGGNPYMQPRMLGGYYPADQYQQPQDVQNFMGPQMYQSQPYQSYGMPQAFQPQPYQQLQQPYQQLQQPYQQLQQPYQAQAYPSQSFQQLQQQQPWQTIPEYINPSNNFYSQPSSVMQPDLEDATKVQEITNMSPGANSPATTSLASWPQQPQQPQQPPIQNTWGTLPSWRRSYTPLPGQSGCFNKCRPNYGSSCAQPTPGGPPGGTCQAQCQSACNIRPRCPRRSNVQWAGSTMICGRPNYNQVQPQPNPYNPYNGNNVWYDGWGGPGMQPQMDFSSAALNSNQALASSVKSGSTSAIRSSAADTNRPQNDEAKKN